MESLFFAAVLHAGDFAAMRLVDPERDLTPAWAQVYAWIMQFVSDQGKLPKPLTVAGQWHVQLPQPPESAAYYAQLLQTNAKRARLEEELSERVVPHLEGHRPDEAIDATAEVLTGIRSAFPAPDDSRCYLENMAINVDERWADYHFRSQHREALGLPLPWQSITRMTRGLQPGEAWCLVSRPNVGKSWAALLIAVYLWQSGYRVLFASMETPPRSAKPRTKRARERLGAAADTARQRLTVRIDALAARVSAWRLLNGTLTPPEMDRFTAYLKACREGFPQWGDLRVVSSPLVRTIGHIEQMAMEYEPDIIIWDSAYLAIGRRGRYTQKRTDQAGYFLEDTKHCFERLGIPGIITWHFNRDVDENAIKASLNDIALSDDMGRLFDVILALFRTPEMHDAGEALWRSLKIRDGINIPELRTRFEVKSCIAFDEIAFGPAPGRDAA